jgi:UDP-N-acetylglucosamine/UDP-N-acetylgalactosamine diphosphorylase
MLTHDDAKARLNAVGQGHLLNFYPTLSAAQQQILLMQIESLDLDAIPGLVEAYVKNKPVFALPPDLGPAPYYPREHTSALKPWDRAEVEKAGEALLRAGKVAAFVVAGGQGSRLGFEGPKGCFPAGPVTGKSLFEVFADNIAGASRRHGAAIPWYIMTSPLNHEATVEFFKKHRFFGLSQNDVMFFPQGVLASLDAKTGDVLMTSRHEIATNPDGHGGSIRALKVSGALDDMRRRGVEHISYFQVDNPLVRVIDPAFIGLHATAKDSSGEMSSKMIPKAYPEEKMGVFCASQGKVEVIEYSDLPAELQAERLPDGSLRFIAGSIAIHMMSVEFVERLASDPKFSLPYHRAEKKVPCIDPRTGEPQPAWGNNGVKLERFVFDALSLCRASIVYETDRAEEFAPIKNATGVDSVETSRAMQSARAARWFEACGVQIPKTDTGEPDCVLELSGRTATSASELMIGGLTLPPRIERGMRLAL